MPGQHPGADRSPGQARDAAGPSTGARSRQHRRGDQPFASVDDLWPRAGVDRIAEADSFRPAMTPARREALWAIKVLHDQPLPLRSAASARAVEYQEIR